MIGLPQQKLATSFFSVNLLYDDKFSLCVSPVSGGASDNGTVLYYLIVKGRNHIYYCILQPMYQNPFQRYYCIFKCNPKPFKVIAFSHMLYIFQNFAVKIVFIAFYMTYFGTHSKGIIAFLKGNPKPVQSYIASCPTYALRTILTSFLECIKHGN